MPIPVAAVDHSQSAEDFATSVGFESPTKLIDFLLTDEGRTHPPSTLPIAIKRLLLSAVEARVDEISRSVPRSRPVDDSREAIYEGYPRP